MIDSQPENPGHGLSETTPARIDALVRLLGDDDPKISSVAWDHLEKIGDAALPLLRDAERESRDPRVRVQSKRFLVEWRRREVFRLWMSFCRSERTDLEQGALLISRTEYPDADAQSLAAMLDHYASALHSRVRGARTTGEAVKRVSQLLFSEIGFRANAADYYNPDNSYLNRVLESRKGIPISLSVVFLLVARRLTIPLHGVSMPQHFLLKYREAGREHFVDAFHRGKLLSARDCRRFLSEAGIAFRETFLRGVTDRVILQRMLGNLLRVYLRGEDRRRSDRVALMLKLLA